MHISYMEFYCKHGTAWQVNGNMLDLFSQGKIIHYTWISK